MKDISVIKAERAVDGVWTVLLSNDASYQFVIGWALKNFAAGQSFSSFEETEETFKLVRSAVWSANAAECVKNKKLVKMVEKAHWDKKLERWVGRDVITYEGGVPRAELVTKALEKSKAKMEERLTAMRKDAQRIYRETGVETGA